MRVGIVAKVEHPRVVQVVRKIMKTLEGEEVLLERRLAKKLKRPPSSPDSFRKADAVVAAGGDGTVLLAQKLASGVPVLGVHLAGRGFLADVEMKDLEKAMKALKSGKLRAVERQRLAPRVGKKRLPQALNDVVICRADAGRTVKLRVSVNGRAVMETKGDGVIVSTPTGSTAYARSAGGPVLDPSSEANLVVPVCPVDSRLTPLAVHRDSKVVVEVTGERAALVCIDGEQEASLSVGEKLVISRSEVPAHFLEWGDFHRKLKERL